MEGRHLDFQQATERDMPAFLGVMKVLHAEPLASAFARLLAKDLRQDDYLHLAHLFEEVSVLLLHDLLNEALVYDAFALDMYWDEIREDIVQLRRRTGNEKLGENFEIAADRAREYRRLQPPKLRWSQGPRWHDEPPPPPPPARPPDRDPERPRTAGTPIALPRSAGEAGRGRATRT